MITDSPAQKQTARAPTTATYAAKLLAGPVAFVIVMALSLELPYQGHVALATFACVVVWWITQPMPWAISAMLPFLVFPAAGVMDIAATMRLYGQPIFFWIMGTVLMGYAVEKHGLARRIALGFLALPGVGNRAGRLTFTYMLMVACVSMFISDAATVAMMIPIGMSVVRHVRADHADARGLTNFGALITLGTLYAAVAGGTATMMGVPHNGITIAMLERFTQRQLGFFEWMIVGVPVSIGGLVAMFVTLWMLAKPELRELPGGEAFLKCERARLGPLSRDERRVSLVFATMVVLFALPAIASLALGETHPATAAINRALPVWVVPPVVLFLLFGIRSAADPGEGLLTWKDAEQRSPWNTMLLVTAGVAMTDALTEFGFVDLMGGAVRSLGVGPTLLPYLAATAVAVTTEFISGTAAATLYCSIFVPAAAQIGYNPASIAILIANVAIGVALPWAGATSATAFAAGDVDMWRMVRIGVAATAVLVVVTATIHLILAPFL